MFGRRDISRIFALLLLFSLVGVVGLSGHLVLRAYWTNEREIAQQKLVIGKLKYALAHAKKAEHSSVPATEDLTSLGFFSGSSDAIVASKLQSQLKSIATANKITVHSAQVAGSQTKGDIRFIGVRFSIVGSLAGLHGALRAVESANPFLLVTFVKIQSDVRSDLKAQSQLKMEIEVAGALPAGDRKDVRG